MSKGKKGFFLSSFFGLKEETAIEILDSCEKEGTYPESFCLRLGFNRFMLNDEENRYFREENLLCPKDEVKALQKVVLDFTFNFANDYAKELLGREEYQKVLQCYERCQYDNKNLMFLLNKICYILEEIDAEQHHIVRTILKVPFLVELKKIMQKKIMKEYGSLKSILIEITSGVNEDCFKDVEGKDRLYLVENDSLTKELNTYIHEKYKYDFNESIPRYGSFEEDINRVLQHFLFEDANFWTEHKYLSIIKLLNNVLKYNDMKHAQKIIDFIFKKLMNDENGKRIIENSYPFEYFFADKQIKHLEIITWRFNFERFTEYYSIDCIRNCVCCYPLNPVEHAAEKINEGKEIISKLFQLIYPNDFDKVMEFIFEKLENNQNIFSLEDWTMRNELEITRINFVDKRYVSYINNLCSEYFTVENILNRLYLLGYYFKILTESTNIAAKCLFEVYYELFEDINEEFNLATSFQTDTASREQVFHNLKNLLLKYNLSIDEAYKEKYIISQLDRKVANSFEKEQFPVLEQLGDAIYGLAVAELLFFNPTLFLKSEAEHSISLPKLYQDYTCAAKQVEISHKIGLSQFYFSAVVSSHSKYDEKAIKRDDKYLYWKFNEKTSKENYLADSLEMLIGAICKEFGYEKALTFSKQLLKENYPEIFKDEIRLEDFKEHSKDEEIDEGYWETIIPSLLTSTNHNQDMLWKALDKFLCCYILGTETKEKRNFITDYEKRIKLYSMDYVRTRITPLYFDYFRNGGLKRVIDTYSNTIKQNYEKITKQ